MRMNRAFIRCTRSAGRVAGLERAPSPDTPETERLATFDHRRPPLIQRNRPNVPAKKAKKLAANGTSRRRAFIGSHVPSASGAHTALNLTNSARAQAPAAETGRFVRKEPPTG